MDSTAITTLITGTLTTFGSSVLAIITAVIGIGVAYLIFRFGWRKVKGSLDDRTEARNEASWLSRQ